MTSHPPKEKRKVQISGKSSCMISLPKRWVNEMGLVQGSPLSISRHNSTSLLISVDKNFGNSVAKGEDNVGVLSLTNPESPETTVRKISCLYVQGYNVIKVRLAENSIGSIHKSAIRELLRRQLIGVEIVSDSLDGLLLQILLGKSELTIENAMKRMSIVSSAMLEDAVGALRLFDKKRAREVIEKDEIERFGSYTARHILGSINHDVFKEGDDAEPEKLAINLMISRAIENAAKCARDIAEQAIRMGSPLDDAKVESLNHLGECASEIFDSAILSFFKRDSRAAERTIERSKEYSVLERSITDLYRSAHSTPGTEQIMALISSMGSLRNVVHHSMEISSLVLGLTTEQYVRNEEGLATLPASGLLLN
ncbi:MAG TPA: PhoU domain-containing protein [Nitrososphaerales archaeon]|nr:PhoU domain-containing protein [Nitrososphaerales archaeon]